MYKSIYQSKLTAQYFKHLCYQHTTGSLQNKDILSIYNNSPNNSLVLV